MIMRKLLFYLILLSIGANNINGQNRNLFVPLELSYFPGYEYRIPWEEELGSDTWIRILTYSLTNPKDSKSLFYSNKIEYTKRINKMLYTRNECDSLIVDYLSRLTSMFSYIKKYGEGAFYEQQRSGARLYRRCVCIPASEIKDLPHGDTEVVGIPIKYINPEAFVNKFKRYRLDSLDLIEAPYFSIFPLDINPSFDCSKAFTLIEKAICRNKELAILDKELSQAYKEALIQKGVVVKSQQNLWIQKRDKTCENINDYEKIISILGSLYKERIKELHTP